MKFERININPEILGGKPLIRNMRIGVIDILEMLAGGMSYKEIMADYPYLEKEDIFECLKYAAYEIKNMPYFKEL